MYGQFDLIDAENENVFVYTRQLEGKTVVVAGNLTDKQKFINITFWISKRMQSNYITTIVN